MAIEFILSIWAVFCFIAAIIVVHATVGSTLKRVLETRKISAHLCTFVAAVWAVMADIAETGISNAVSRDTSKLSF